MNSIKDFSVAEAKKLKYLLCDIDDTITTRGKLTAEAYSALWKLQQNGIKIVPITGRPAGWCDLIIRQWPVEAVVGENGAFVMYFEEGKQKILLHKNTEKDSQIKLKKIEHKVLKEIPHTRTAKDQFCRMFDLAIDFAEDPPYLGFETADEIRDICVKMGATAKVSSIHVNAWFGDYNKVSMTKMMFEEIFKEKNYNECSIFFGDSPNDEPMFEFFSKTCGVKNILPFIDSLKTKPQYIAEFESGDGFVAAVEHILDLRGEYLS